MTALLVGTPEWRAPLVLPAELRSYLVTALFACVLLKEMWIGRGWFIGSLVGWRRESCLPSRLRLRAVLGKPGEGDCCEWSVDARLSGGTIARAPRSTESMDPIGGIAPAAPTRKLWVPHEPVLGSSQGKAMMADPFPLSPSLPASHLS